MNNTTMDYLQHTDKYFQRTFDILQAKGINPTVRYQVFARKDLEHITGINEAVDFIHGVAGNNVRVFALPEGSSYSAGEPIMKLEGKVQDLVRLETMYLSILSGAITGPINMDEVKKNAHDIVQAAEGKPVFYFGARHFDYRLDEQIGKLCQEEGFVGASTDIAAKAWGAEGIGTTPHALIMDLTAYMHINHIDENPTALAMKYFDEVIDPKVPRIMLIDTFNREITDSIETARTVPRLQGVRIDTCGENHAQGVDRIEHYDFFYRNLADLEIDMNKYWHATGVTIPGVIALRQGLDQAGFPDLKLTVSSGFNQEKTREFRYADYIFSERYHKPLFDSIGTGSVAHPIMTTSDIVAYFHPKANAWLPLSKVGRKEAHSDRLVEV